MKSVTCIFAAFLLVPSPDIVLGQAIVDATGATPGSVTTITEAINGSESEIIVKNTGVYNESLLITRSVLLRGEDPNDRPVVALKGNPTQPAIGTGDGIYAGGTIGGTEDLTIEIRDFIFIPSLTDQITDDGFSVTPNVGAVLNYTMHNVLCAPNDGSDAPLATSVWDNPVGGTRVPGAWFYLMDDAFGGFNGDINTTVTDCLFIGAGTDATVFYPGEGGSIYVSGIGTSHCGRYGTQTSDMVPVTITGTKENPGWVARENLVGLIIFQGAQVNIDNIVVLDNGNTALRVDADTVGTLNLSESLFVNNLTQGLYIPFASTQAKSWTVSDCTFVNNGANTGAGVFSNIQLTNTTVDSANLTLTVTDSVFGGPSAPGVENQGSATVIVNNSALILNGDQALPSATLGTVVLNDVIDDDPVFASIDTDPIVEDSFDVTAAAYATASSTGGNLNGWGEGPSPSTVAEWSLY